MGAIASPLCVLGSLQLFDPAAQNVVNFFEKLSSADWRKKIEWIPSTLHRVHRQ